MNLAACYRLVAYYGWTDSIATHISARIPGEDAFLLNPYGLLFEEVTASNLVKIDLAGNILSPTEHSINPAGFVVHSAVHEARHDIGCVIHLHTDDGVAVSCLEEGLLPLNQTAMLLAHNIAYHDYEGVALDLDERKRLGSDLGLRQMMILRNHGTLTVGHNVAEAFLRMYLLERACSIQVRALSMGRPLKAVTAEAIERSAQTETALGGPIADVAWEAHKRLLNAERPDYRM
ncbi:class II aldolase/adducin family protein [Brevundimonas sp. AJA228-03]|uniref:class II aldolase/adducin family protein n=1 Tax=Brevundimonas sp. AJA228-03 TaxID=2752515 RepID=UPI00352FF0CF